MKKASIKCITQNDKTSDFKSPYSVLHNTTQDITFFYMIITSMKKYIYMYFLSLLFIHSRRNLVKNIFKL